MRKFLSFAAAIFITGSLFAGGLVTNTNQSAAWVRLPARNASTEIDAVYFNPAGLMKLENGFHISLSNQSIFQTREISNTYAGPSIAVAPAVTGVNYGLNDNTYIGNVKALAFPSFFAVYKMDKLAFSLGFGVVGGGGGAEYKTGLPSFEMSPSDLVPSLSKAGVTGYKLDAYFKGSSAFFGYQGGVSYKINDMISIAAGIRYVTAKNTYEGHLNDIMINLGGAFVPVKDGILGIAGNLTAITGIPTKLAPAIAGGFGGQTLAVLVGAGAMTATDKASIEAGLAAIGVPAAAIPTMTVSTISGTVTGATPSLNAQVAQLTATANYKPLSNQSVDVAQKGHGFTPIFSVNISPSDKINIALKYEMKTKLELENETKQDITVGYTAALAEITMFPDGAKTRNDMPAMLTIGIDYKILSNLKVSVGSNYWFDKSADYGHKVDADLDPTTPTTHIANKDIIEKNGANIQLGLEYNITDKILVSGGYILSNKGANLKYQSDLTYANSSQTFGAGGAYDITEKIRLNLGASYTAYAPTGKNVDHVFTNSTGVKDNALPYEVYKKKTFMVGLGLDFRF